jgi:transposase-like protein
MLIVTRVNEDGYREVLGLRVGDSEASPDGLRRLGTTDDGDAGARV